MKVSTKILIATDGSADGTAALDMACELMDPEATAVKVVSSYVATYQTTGEPTFLPAQCLEPVDRQLRQLAADIVEDAASRIRSRFPDVDLTTETTPGEPDIEIVELAALWGADLIVVGSHGYGLGPRSLGPVSDAVVHHAPCSVLVVRRGADLGLDR